MFNYKLYKLFSVVKAEGSWMVQLIEPVYFRQKSAVRRNEAVVHGEKKASRAFCLQKQEHNNRRRVIDALGFTTL